ncbi:MAG: DUF2244 domain-containing protein [Rhodospirillaceae bacterium]|nr:DUF2244 domain-containing protein [Rhodospirillaceae bacterium]
MTQPNSSENDDRTPASDGSAALPVADAPVVGADMDAPGDTRPAPDAADAAALFDAVLTPHRSLSPTGFTIMMGAIAAVGFIGGMAFLLAGAWPVTGFGVIEIGLFYLLFRLNYRSGRIRERIRLTATSLEIERRLQDGTIRRWSFQPYWLKVHIADPPDTDSRLTLSSHGKSLSIGAFLSPDERLEFANALRAELARLRETGPA